MAKLVHPDVRLDALEKHVRALDALVKTQTKLLTEARQRIAMLQSQVQVLAQRRS